MDTDEFDVDERAWQRMAEARRKDGYRQGASEGRERALQQGFNEGYEHTVMRLYSLSRLQGIISAMHGYLLANSDSSEKFNDSMSGLQTQLQMLEKKWSAVVPQESFNNPIPDKSATLSEPTDSDMPSLSRLSLHTESHDIVGAENLLSSHSLNTASRSKSVAMASSAASMDAETKSSAKTIVVSIMRDFDFSPKYLTSAQDVLEYNDIVAKIRTTFLHLEYYK